MSLQEMGKKIRKSLKKRYFDIASRFINFQLPDDPIHSLKETLQLFAMAGIRNSYVATVSRDMKATRAPLLNRGGDCNGPCWSFTFICIV